MERREWKWLTGGLILDIVLVGILAEIEFSLETIVILVLLVDLLLVGLRTLYQVIPEEQTKILAGADEVLKLARDSIHEARRGDTIIAMWTVMEFSNALRSYFNETLQELSNKGARVQRLVDVKHISLHAISQHILDTQQYLRNRSYKIVFVPDAPSFEMLLVGNKYGIIFNSYRENTLATGCTDEKIINRLMSFYTDILAKETIEFDPTAIHDYNETEISEYIKEIKVDLGVE